MNFFIFGFHRFVWCPKWTPASRRSFIETEAKVPPSRDDVLALRVLEPLARSGLTVFLPFLLPRISRQKAFRLELLAQLGVEVEQRPGHAVPDRPRLPRDPTACD